MTRRAWEWLVSVMRRNSTSSSGETLISRVDFQAGLSLAKLRAGLREDGFVAFGGAQGGLMGGGPEFSRRQIAQINKSPPAIARGILAPAGDGQVAPAAVAAAAVLMTT